MLYTCIYALKAFLLLKIICKSIFSKPFKDFKSASNSTFMIKKIKKNCFAFIYSSQFFFHIKFQNMDAPCKEVHTCNLDICAFFFRFLQSWIFFAHEILTGIFVLDMRSYLLPSALHPLPYKGKVRSTFIFVQNIFSDKSLLLLLYYILPTYVCWVSVGFISMLLTYISDISVEFTFRIE